MRYIPTPLPHYSIGKRQWHGDLSSTTMSCATPPPSTRLCDAQRGEQLPLLPHCLLIQQWLLLLWVGFLKLLGGPLCGQAEAKQGVTVGKGQEVVECRTLPRESPYRLCDKAVKVGLTWWNGMAGFP